MTNKNFWKGFVEGWTKAAIILSPAIALIIWELVK